MMKKILVCLSISPLLLANPFQTTLENEISWLKEESFVVSASKVKENINKTASSITVIDQEMIESMGANTILDVLSTVAGVGITQSNIYVKEIEVRGIKDWFSKQVLFMIDGHSLDANLINGGSTWNLDRMNLDNIERIEVIKGPASSLYGANAFTALINIITKKAKDIDGTLVKAKIGSFDTKEANILFGKKYNDLSVVANLNILDTNGDSVFVKKDVVSNSGNTNPFLKQLKADLKIEYKDFYLSSMLSKREDGQYFGAAGALNDETKPNNDYYFIEAGYKKDINEDLNINVRLYFDKYKFYNTWELFENGLKMINGVTNEKNGVESFVTYKINDELTTVVGFVSERHKQYDVITIQNFDALTYAPLGSMVDMSNTSSTFAPDVKRSMWAGYINNLYDITNDLRLTIGARYDNYSDFGSNFAPRGGISWQINNDNIFKIMYGEGFRTPTFAESYNVSVVLNGNNSLNPEKVLTYEASLENSSFENLSAKLTYFHNSFKDLIIKDGNIYVNSGKIKTQGVELETKYDLYRGSYFKANYTYQQAKDEITNRDLPNIAAHKGNLFLNYKINKYLNSLNHISLKGKTKRAFGDTRDDVSGYAILNTSLILKKLYKNFELKASIDNLLDKKAYDPSTIGLTYDDYQKVGRNFMLEARYAF